MRPTTGTMLQQNNNNNYPCLNVSGSTRDMLQKCSRASLPFPGRMELGDLPLIRELRAWALCSKNRRRTGGQAPIVPPGGRGGSSPCSQPGDVYLSGEWGRMGYGLPLGLDGGQAGIGALVTVATLKTSEGSGKTQTQCLFLRTEKGSYLYSTAKPSSGVSASAASSVVGGWLRGKTRSRDTPAGRRDGGPAPQAQTGANRVRVRSGRRWRKSCNTGVSRELRGSGGEDPAGEIILEERQEDGDKGDCKEFPRSPRCSHNESPKTCAQCGRGAERRDESPRRGEAKGMRRERQKNEEEEAEPNPDLESNHYDPESHGGYDGEETREPERDENTSHIDVSRVATEDLSRHIRDQDHRKPGEDLCVNGFEDTHEEETELEDFDHVPVSTCPPQPSAPVGGSTCSLQLQTPVWKKQEDPTDAAEENTVNEDEKPQIFYQNVETSSEKEDGGAPASTLRHRDPFRSEDDDDDDGWRLEESGDTCGPTSTTRTEATNVPSTSTTLLLANPAPSLPPLGSMATGLPCLEAEKEKEEEEEEGREGVEVTVDGGEGGQEGKRELEEPGEEERGSTVAAEEGRKEEEEEDEFGVFMQAEGEPAWSEGSSMSASVPCGSRGSVAPTNHAISGESTHWTPGWTDGSFHQSDDTWAAFPQESSDDGREDAAVGQWWPTSAVEQGRDRLLANQNLASVFAEAFPSLPASSSTDLDAVPTLTQVLRGGADQDQGLLDSFHDLNKMICQRYKRGNGVSRDLLLKTLHLEQPHAVRPAQRTANRRLSPGLPSSNQLAQNAAAKRRLSYDYNRNIME
ncbi:uncharacterized protein LOC141797439 isoform X2 [Halichoeres trimaculatus]|uniref:uncharacterized protein LOC141797439 isoform X2 n=1 Tax=Halichoeres trimaculatus TaxID=147232 RepID=UPI003D9F7AAB